MQPPPGTPPPAGQPPPDDQRHTTPPRRRGPGRPKGGHGYRPPGEAPSHGLDGIPGQSGARAQEALTVSAAESSAFAVIETELGGRGKLVATLLSADLDHRLRRLVGMLADPLNDSLTLAQVCKTLQVSLPKLMKAFQAAITARATLIATGRIADKTPDVAAAVMDDAIPGDRLCRRCLGSGKLTDPNVAPTEEVPNPIQDCYVCHGSGQVWHTPNHEVQKTALKLAGILVEPKAVNINQQVFAKGGDQSYDVVVERLDAILYGVGRERLRSAPAAGPTESVPGSPAQSSDLDPPAAYTEGEAID